MDILCYVISVVLFLWNPLHISAKCSEGFFMINGSEQCFKFFGDVKRTWEESNKKCEAEGLMSAMPSSSTAAINLRKYLLDRYGNGKVTWLHAQGDGSKFILKNSGTVLRTDSHLWFPKMPGNGITLEHCLAISVWDISWQSYPGRPYSPELCIHSHYTLCEEPIELRQPSTPTKSPPLHSTEDDALCQYFTQEKCLETTIQKKCPIMCKETIGHRQPSSTSKSPSSTSKAPSSTSRTPSLYSKATCGQSTRVDERTVSERVTGGHPAITGQYPFMVHFTYFSSFHDRNTHCGGTLVSSRWVLTAAHCFKYLKSHFDVYVKIGFVDLKRQENEALVFSINLDDIETHPEFNPTTLENDIALVHLPNEVTLGRLIKTICLGTNQLIAFGGKAIAAGWGLHKPSDGEIPNILHDVELDVLNETSCTSPDHFICTYTAGKDTCRGDSGGPLMVLQDGQWYQIGIVSHGPTDCGTHTSPAHYTRVPNYLAFINNIISF